MYPWISRTLDFGLQFCEKKCGLYMDVYGKSLSKLSHVLAMVLFSLNIGHLLNGVITQHIKKGLLCKLCHPVLSIRFDVGVSLLLAPARADKRGPKASFPLVENAGIQPAIRKKVPARAPEGSRVLLKALAISCPLENTCASTLNSFKTSHK